MARIRLVLLVLVVLAVGFPSSAATRDVRCSQVVHSGGSAACWIPFKLPHFTPDDAIDYDTLVATIVSPQANSWRVQARISDAKGKVYFAWECVVGRSVMVGSSTSYFDRSCTAWRKIVYKNGHPTYYTADTSRRQVLTVTAQVGSCAGSCRFEGAATYLLAG